MCRYCDSPCDIEPGTCHCGCERPTNVATFTSTRKGHKKGEPVKFLNGHGRRRSPIDWIIDSNGCFVWQLALNPDGYGWKFADGRPNLAHRWAWELSVGEIEEETLDHLCFNPQCINPDHLEPVSRRVNTQRSHAHSRGEWHGLLQLSGAV